MVASIETARVWAPAPVGAEEGINELLQTGRTFTGSAQKRLTATVMR